MMGMRRSNRDNHVSTHVWGFLYTVTFPPSWVSTPPSAGLQPGHYKEWEGREEEEEGRKKEKVEKDDDEEDGDECITMKSYSNAGRYEND